MGGRFSKKAHLADEYPASEREELVIALPLDCLRKGPSPRRGSVRAEQVEALLATPSTWPPILVHRPSMAVIDGHHRLAAAKRLGLTSISAVYFDGNSEMAELEAIRRNVTHGMPLTLAERRSAASRILKRYPGWSDSKVAEICGVSSKTVGRLRSQVVGGSNLPTEWRVGRDGKRHPARSGAARDRVLKLLADQPSLTVRDVAETTGVSEQTVRSVRKRLEEQDLDADRGTPPELVRENRSISIPHIRSVEAPYTGLQKVSVWHNDTACSSTEAGQLFATWFDGHSIDNIETTTYVSCVPLSRIYDVIDESQRRSKFWSNYALELNRRVR